VVFRFIIIIVKLDLYFIINYDEFIKIFDWYLCKSFHFLRAENLNLSLRSLEDQITINHLLRKLSFIRIRFPFCYLLLNYFKLYFFNTIIKL